MFKAIIRILLLFIHEEKNFNVGDPVVGFRPLHDVLAHLFSVFSFYKILNSCVCSICRINMQYMPFIVYCVEGKVNLNFLSGYNGSSDARCRFSLKENLPKTFVMKFLPKMAPRSNPANR